MNSICFAIVATTLASLSVAPAAAEALGQIPQVPVRLGAGFNVITPEKIYPACIVADIECQTGIKNAISCVSPTSQGKAQTIPTKEFAPSSSFSMREIRSKYDYFRELNITASMSGSYGIFSGAASFSYHSIDDIDEESVSWAITSKSNFGSFALANPKVLPEFSALPGGKLLDTCGPQYVAEVDRGVLASVLYTYHARSEEKLREFSARLSAGLNAGVWSASGSGSYSEFISEMLKTGNVSIKVFTIGGAGASSLKGLIVQDMTNLDGIKSILADYVANQKMADSTILGFRTSSIGKLVKKPEIDPDYSSYLFFLDRINQYRLQLQDMSRKLDRLLLRPDDFSKTKDSNGAIQDRLSCELEYINVRAGACRLWIDTLVTKLANGDSSDDAEANSQMKHGSFVSGNTTDKKRNSCIKMTDARANFAAIEGLAFGTKTLLTLDNGDKSSCSFQIDQDLMASLASLPQYPFDISYAFDPIGGIPTFPGTSGQALYVKLVGAEQIEFVQVRDQDRKLLAHEANEGAASFGFATALDEGLKGQPLTIQVNTTSGGFYELLIEVPTVR